MPEGSKKDAAKMHHATFKMQREMGEEFVKKAAEKANDHNQLKDSMNEFNDAMVPSEMGEEFVKKAAEKANDLNQLKDSMNEFNDAMVPSEMKGFAEKMVENQAKKEQEDIEKKLWLA